MRSASYISNLVRLACVLALVIVGFAHRPASADPASMPAHVLPDGTYASLCIGDHDDTPGEARDFGCDACRLASAVLIPAPLSVESVAIVLSGEVKVFERRHRLARALYPPSSGPRAPPSGSMFL